MAPEQKIWKLSNANELPNLLGKQQSVICYGHFNIIHPGHIRYLEYAKSLGQTLIVAVQGDHMLTHSGNSHHFSANDRALGLGLLHIVDIVLILDSGELTEAIQLLQPNSLVLGKEFEKSLDGKLKEAFGLIQTFGGKVIFHAGEIHYATTDLLLDESRNQQSDRWWQFQSA
jgi:cytidyltransferase-like protein